MVSRQTIVSELIQASEELERCKKKMLQLKKQLASPLTQNYTFSGPDNSRVRLSELFGKHQDLIVIHNMGANCRYCTLWADGFNGLLAHLESRAAFVLISPDDPQTQQRFAQQREWKFRMLSSQGTTFRADMGFEPEGQPMPGVSVFHRNADGNVTHEADDFFDSGDNYCSLWHLFDLLPAGSQNWEPQYSYGD